MLEIKPRWWIPFGFPRKKWILFIDMYKCLPAYYFFDFLHTNEVDRVTNERHSSTIETIGRPKRLIFHLSPFSPETPDTQANNNNKLTAMPLRKKTTGARDCLPHRV